MARDLHRPLREAWIVDAVRTPIGRYGGALAAVRPDDLAALVIRAVVDRTGVDPSLIEDVIRRNPAEWVWMHERWRTQPPPEQADAPQAKPVPKTADLSGG